MIRCPICGDQDAQDRTVGGSGGFACLDCGHVWRRPEAGDGGGENLAAAADPRELLRALWRARDPGAVIVVSAPAGEPAGSPFAEGEWHRFAPAGMARLIVRCGFRVLAQRRTARAGRPWLTIEAERRADDGAAVAGTYLAELAAARQRAAERIAAAGERRAALWGLGSDLAAMAAAVPLLREGLEAGRFALFDQSAAGQERHGRPVAAPASLSVFDGVVFPTPSSASVRGGMRLAAAGWSRAHFVDPYDPPV